MKTSTIIYGALGAAVVGGVGYYGYRYYKRSAAKNTISAARVAAGQAALPATAPLPTYVVGDDVSVTSATWDKAVVQSSYWSETGGYTYILGFSKGVTAVGSAAYSEADIAAGTHAAYATEAAVPAGTNGAFAGAAIQVIR